MPTHCLVGLTVAEVMRFLIMCLCHTFLTALWGYMMPAWAYYLCEQHVVVSQGGKIAQFPTTQGNRNISSIIYLLGVLSLHRK